MVISFNVTSFASGFVKNANTHDYPSHGQWISHSYIMVRSSNHVETMSEGVVEPNPQEK